MRVAPAKVTQEWIGGRTRTRPRRWQDSRAPGCRFPPPLSFRVRTGLLYWPFRMKRYVILTNSRRAAIALAHSVVFLLIAARGLGGGARPLHFTSPASAWMIFGIYLVVSSILVVLTALSGAALERLYFALCASSATAGLLRAVLGDPRMHPAVYLRLVMLAFAVVTGLLISRAHRSVRPAPAGPAPEQA